MRLFSYDSKAMRFFNHMFDAMILTLLWWISCIPIVTIGAATTALFNTTMILAERDAKPWRLYKESFKKYWRPATICWLILLLLGLFIGFDYLFFETVFPQFLGVVKVITFILLITYVFTLLYLFPVICTFSGTIFQLIFNAFILSFMHAPYTIIMVGLYLLSFYVGLKMSMLMAAAFLLVPGGIAFMNSFLFNKLFKEYVNEGYNRYNALVQK